MLSDAVGCIGFSWAASPACTELETIVLDWYAKALDLPQAFMFDIEKSRGGGAIQGSASECILVTMLAARAQAIRSLKLEDSISEDSLLLPRLVAYCSSEAHSCVEKAAMICLVKLRVLEPDEKCCLRGEVLETAILEDLAQDLVPFYVSATLGTTGCCAFDNLQEIGSVCQQFPSIWLHVDGAYAGNCFICPEMRFLMTGVNYADSFNTNPNKWLLVNFDCSCLWVKDRVKLTSALVVDPLYLQHANSSESIDYRHWGIPLSRRFRALKLWFVLRSYGIKGLQSYIRNHIQLAKRFEARLLQDDRFEVINEVQVGLVCFRLKQNDEINQELLANINASGKLHMIPARIRGRYSLRFCVINEHATAEDINFATNIIQEHATMLISHYTLIESKLEDKQENLNQLHGPNSPLDKRLVRKFSFTRSVTKDVYKRSRSKTSLHDGATPIIVVEDSVRLNPTANIIEEDFSNDLIK